MCWKCQWGGLVSWEGVLPMSTGCWKQILTVPVLVLVLAGLLFLAGGAAGQGDWNAVTLSDTVVTFGWVTTGEAHSLVMTLANHLDSLVHVTGAAFEESCFSTDLTGMLPLEIPADSSRDFQIFFNSPQNVDYTDFLRIDLDAGTRSLIAEVSAQAQYPDAYYACTQNKWAEELKDSLTNLIDGHTALGYTTARDSMYGSIDNVDGWVECVYTGRTAFFNTRAGATANGFNCEHTWPQSLFGEAEPMKSDIFHLYPTDETANSMRGNLDFGVVTTVSWTAGGSKMGTDSQGQTVFEPRDAHKGNVARTHFYFVIRYNGAYDGYQNSSKMEDHFRVWHMADPVDSAEQARNQHIYTVQHNRNPFIDHPELADRISSFFGVAVRDLAPEIAVAPGAVSLGEVGTDTTVTYHVAVVNAGTDTLHITSVVSTNPAFDVDPASLTLGPEAYAYLGVTYQSGQLPISDSTRIQIASDDADEALVEIPVSVEVGGCAGVDLRDIDGGTAGVLCLYQNAPNPFSLRTTIAFNLDRAGIVDLAVYNIEGKLVGRLLDDRWLPAGEHRLTFGADAFQGAELPPGVYYYRLSAGTRIAARAMLLLDGQGR
jgi:deoxyribonuclease-1